MKYGKIILSMYMKKEPDKIKTPIKGLNSKKTSNIFGILANFLKCAGDKIILPLAFLFQK